jgi:hypothetical protein
MNEAMMQQITNDRINNARQQAKAHRMARQARTDMIRGVEKDPIQRETGLFSMLLTAVTNRLGASHIPG